MVEKEVIYTFDYGLMGFKCASGRQYTGIVLAATNNTADC